MTKFLRRLALVPPFALLGACAKPQAAEPVVAAAPEQPPAPAPAAPQPQPPEAQPAAPVTPPAPPAPTFAFPADLGGQALARAVAPDTARPLPAARFATEPAARVLPTRVREPEAVVRGSYAPPPLLAGPLPPPKPAAPPERVPIDLGTGSDKVPARPVLPVAAVETPRARDVNLPPPAPALGRPVPDRVGFDDPTSDHGNAVIVADRAAVPLAAAGFLKAVVPDPFELGAQVKPAVPPAAEPSAAPIPLDPRRVK